MTASTTMQLVSMLSAGKSSRLLGATSMATCCVDSKTCNIVREWKMGFNFPLSTKLVHLEKRLSRQCYIVKTHRFSPISQ